jgi:hypothetical protein
VGHDLVDGVIRGRQLTHVLPLQLLLGLNGLQDLQAPLLLRLGSVTDQRAAQGLEVSRAL